MSTSEARRHALRLAVAALLLGTAAQAALAQAANSREQEQIRRLRQQVQQLQQAQAEQQQAAQRAGAELAALRQRLEAVQAEAGRARGAAAAQARGSAELKGERDALAERTGSLQAQLDAARVDIERRAGTEQQLRADLARGQALLGTRAATFDELQLRHRRQAEGLQACVAANAKLHALGLEFLERYEQQGLAETLSRREPFLQFGRVRLENLLQGYREQLDQSALEPAPGRGS